MEYELTTLKDVFDKVPADRINVCLHELAVAMRQAKAMAELLGATTSALAGQDVGCAVQWPETSTWIDDGKGTLDLHFHGEDGEGLFDYTVQLAPEDKGSNLFSGADLRHNLLTKTLNQGGQMNEPCKGCRYLSWLWGCRICMKHDYQAGVRFSKCQDYKERD